MSFIKAWNIALCQNPNNLAIPLLRITYLYKHTRAQSLCYAIYNQTTFYSWQIYSRVPSANIYHLIQHEFRARINNCIHSFLWYVITHWCPHPCLYFNNGYVQLIFTAHMKIIDLNNYISVAYWLTNAIEIRYEFCPLPTKGTLGCCWSDVLSG